MLTKEKLITMEKGEIIANGICHVDSIAKGKIKWIAIRGGIHDWAIYYLGEGAQYDYIHSNGIKCHHEHVIKQLVPCDEDAYKLYRW